MAPLPLSLQPNPLVSEVCALQDMSRIVQNPIGISTFRIPASSYMMLCLLILSEANDTNAFQCQGPSLIYTSPLTNDSYIYRLSIDSLFPRISMLEHACIHTASLKESYSDSLHYITCNTSCMLPTTYQILANTKLAKSDIVALSYHFVANLPLKQRTAEMHNHYGFVCDCVRCNAIDIVRIFQICILSTNPKNKRVFSIASYKSTSTSITEPPAPSMKIDMSTFYLSD